MHPSTPYALCFLRIHRKKFVEIELAKRLGKRVAGDELDEAEVRRRKVEEDLYSIPEHLKVTQTDMQITCRILQGVVSWIKQGAAGAGCRQAGSLRHLWGCCTHTQVTAEQPGRVGSSKPCELTAL